MMPARQMSKEAGGPTTRVKITCKKRKPTRPSPPNRTFYADNVVKKVKRFGGVTTTVCKETEDVPVGGEEGVVHWEVRIHLKAKKAERSQGCRPKGERYQGGQGRRKTQKTTCGQENNVSSTA